MKYLILLILVNGLSYIASIVMSHLYSSEYFGLLMSYIAIGNVIALIACLGVPEYSLRELSLNNKKVSISALIMSLCIAIILCFVWPLPFNSLKLTLLVISITSVLVSYVCVVLKYRARVVELAFIQKIINVFKIVLMIITSLVFYIEPIQINSGISISITNVLVLVIVLVFFTIHIKNYKSLYEFKSKSLGIDKEALLFFVNEISFFFSYQAAILIMGQRGQHIEVANYSLAVLILSGCGLLINAVFNSMLLSNFYKLFATDKQRSFFYIEKFLRLALFICIPLMLILWIFIKLFYPLVFDLDKYPELISLTLLFIFPIVIKLIYSPLGMTMNLKNTLIVKNKILISVGLFTLVSTYFLSAHYGAIGAIFAFSISESIILVAFALTYKKLKEKSLININISTTN